jgi:hypothetical protein
MNEVFNALKKVAKVTRPNNGESKKHLKVISKYVELKKIDGNTPRDKPLLIYPVIGLPFVGDIWSNDCKKRSDIEYKEVIRRFTSGGSHFVTPLENGMLYVEIQIYTGDGL